MALATGRSVTLLACATLLGGCVLVDDYGRFTFDRGATDASTDVRIDGGGPDATGDAPDTGTMPPVCDAPCLTDAYLDFTTTQGAAPLEWRYQAQTFDDHLDYFDLVPGSHRGGDGWVASPAPPAVVRCEDASPPCAAPFELVLEAGADVGPVLLTTVPTSGRYTVDVSVRAIGTAPTELWVSRNAAADLVGRVAVAPGDPRRDLAVGFEAAPGDRIVVALRNPTGAADAIVSANVRVSTAASPSSCEHVATFDGDLSDACGGTAYEADGSGALPSLTTGPAPYLGMAQELTSVGAGVGLIATGATIDRTGDFTTQLWVNIGRQDYVTSSIYQDWSGPDSAGINFSMEDPSGADVIEANFLYRDADNTSFPGVTCSGGDCSGVLSGPRPPDDRWFHLRLTRSTADDTIRFCVDGVEVARTEILPDADISSALSPKLGFNFGGTPTYRLDGVVDDVRQYTESLPCAPASP